MFCILVSKMSYLHVGKVRGEDRCRSGRCGASRRGCGVQLLQLLQLTTND